MGLDARNLHLGIEKQTIGIQDCTRGVSGSDLDEPPGTPIIQHAKKDYPVRMRVIRIVEMIKQTLGRLSLKRDSPIVALECIQQIELDLVIEVDRGQFVSRLPLQSRKIFPDIALGGHR